MSIKDYRRQIEQEIAETQAAAAEPRWSPNLESAGGLESLGAPSQEDDTARLRVVLSDRDIESDLRCAALAELVEQHPDTATVHEEALARLGDSTENSEVRLAALQILRVAVFHSPTSADWQPAYLAALRDASGADDEKLRYAAFSVLSAMKDRASQEVLLQGLADPDQARIAPELALQFLSGDPHTGVQELAHKLADNRDEEAVRLEALRVLANDPGSVDRFRALFLDSGESAQVRKLAATALYSLDPENLKEIVAGIDAGPDLLSEAAPSISDQHAYLHAAALLRPDP